MSFAISLLERRFLVEQDVCAEIIYFGQLGAARSRESSIYSVAMMARTDRSLTSGLDGLVELALRPWGRPLVGVERDANPERLVELHPSFPIPGPNHVCLVRCAPERADALIDEVRQLFDVRGLPCMWILDPDVEPADLPNRLTARGIVPSGQADVMVLPATAAVEPGDAAVEVVDALAVEAAFWDAEAVQAAAFDDGGPFPGQHERYEEACADPSRRLFLALIAGWPARQAREASQMASATERRNPAPRPISARAGGCPRAGSITNSATGCCELEMDRKLQPGDVVELERGHTAQRPPASRIPSGADLSSPNPARRR